MKVISLILFLTLLAGCDPYGFGFKKNPAFVLNEAYESIKNLDVKRFLNVSGKEALCVYGNKEGMTFLKQNILVKEGGIKLNPKVISTSHFTSPKFVGYWSYYHERYRIEILDKESEEVLMQTVVDCEYGTEGERNSKWVNQKPNRYTKKECRAIKLIPETFRPLDMPEKCESLRVDL